MPLDFNATKDFRDKMLKRTLDPVYGRSPSPKTFTSTNYSVQNLRDSENLLLPNVDDSRSKDLSIPKKSNIFKPAEYLVRESLQDLPRRANLSLYPYFVATENNLLGIMTTRNYDTESELFKFAANNIRTNPQGPVLARINQNLNTTINERNRIGEALGGNTTTLINILRGKEPLIAGNPKITVSNSLLGQGIDFLQTVAGTQLPFSTIPGDYLTNPRNPINVRPTDVSSGTKAWQDLTGVLGSIVGIQRRPLPSRKPSDILIEHMGSSTKNRLFDLLSFSKYAPNYTTSARSQASTTLGKFPSQVAQGFKSLFGMEAPNQGAYIGDDRENDVKQATKDLFSGRPVRSSFYLTRMFDPISAELFHNTKSVIESGPIGGNLTWISKNKTNAANLTNLQKTKSTDFKFRTDSILDITQQMLDTKPQNGGDALAHIGHILDQTSKYFKDGDTLISRGSGVRYIDNSGKDIGVEYARVWTKDRPYLTYGNTMPLYKETTQKPYYNGGTTPFRRTGIRKFDGSVMTNTWNLNIAPMSDGTSSDKFPGSSNILPNPNGKGFYAKKYMLSIENLAWGASTTPGFTVNDLPYSERGPNGGRVMWFPPYDLKVSEQNSAKWEPNTFLGRPEPIYTYQNTERSGQLSFKIVVDHPSILNLLIREHFKSVNETDVDAYINAFFAGAKDIDFYSLIRQYPNLNSDDISMIQNYLNNSKDPAVINNLKNATSGKVADNPGGTSTADANKQNVTKKLDLIFANNLPGDGDSNVSLSNYETSLLPINENESQTKLNDALVSIITTSGDTADRILLFGKDTITSSESGSTINKIITDHQTIFSANNTAKAELTSSLDTLKTDLESKSVKGDVVILISSRTTKSGNEKGNYQLSVRRSHSIYKTILEKINKNNVKSEWNFEKLNSQSFPNGMEVYVYENQYELSKLGYDQTGKLIIRTTNYGYLKSHEKYDCSKVSYNNTDLTRYSPLSYGCRSSSYSIEYSKSNKSDKPVNTSSLTQLTPGGRVSTNNTKPPTDLMKRIIMKTLSEEFYFKKLEETSPMIYSSLKEKLRYFHPGFHSMTPEGLNSRLTFLQQCLRPGDTIPVKGLSDNSDINARNTTFGPPPICVLRVGDFYNSKVVIRDLNIQFESNIWDLNPEGIGIQPMIAEVTMQLNFLGGQGLEKPVERLQNALSSNFFANTEIYDERSISTNTKIGGQDANEFTKEFIQSLSDIINPPVVAKDTSITPVTEGQYIGTIDPKDPNQPSIDYTNVVNQLFEKTSTYFTTYESFYNNILTSYGPILTNLIINKDYRNLDSYYVHLDNLTGTTVPTTINLFGKYKDKTLPTYISELSTWLIDFFIRQYTANNNFMIEFFDLKGVIPNKYETEISGIIHDNIYKILPAKLEEINEIKNIKEFEGTINELIKVFDKLNFITKNGHDIKLEKNKATKLAIGSGTFTSSEFYSNYSGCINYIKDNTEKMYSKLDTSLNFQTMNITEDIAKNIVNPVLKNSVDDIVIGIAIALPSEDYSLLDKIKDKITKWFKNIKEENLKFGKPPIRKNSKPITYVSPPLDISEQPTDVTDEIKWLFGEKNKPTESLNYYRDE